MGEIAAGYRREGADQHLALEREVEHADPPAQHAGERGEQDRRDRLHRRLEEKRGEETDHWTRRPTPCRIARNKMTIACRTSDSTRGTEVSRCMAKPPVWSAAKKKPATIGADRLAADEQRRHQPRPGVGRSQERAVDETELRTEHDDRADKPGDRPAHEHRQHGLTVQPDAAVAGKAQVLPSHAQFVSRRPSAGRR